ncbi:fructoselysine and glucoselysine-specific PTS system IIA component [Breznakia sp. PF5-3]|uniref:PTS sugar transporter subunit IIA n=1 Tax=unclassified Breznakia TaxID=2623764 RepID=UPI0024055E8D|nr:MULTISPECIES: PTS sugar transporter subunit IIA [unclassified Breznakia]MDL2276239.1 PTS sugar transporter subunit IIA [Breznakia sp. OttesenSCG-928-G09]MDF9824897.1 fructoselysine and glucoselysine-specific PTS system IIA component [Breznakia sp. PM6-1]MDF9835604.1 fructoselysine and glucoselysine-specific PTS system IIA component [Breznakia sp. PF5-3]MDF9837980.1 fructoselysine and glucoselysine-specific PTS system IIA component [Breznakia sp. PFB2-8]MDF9859969.1 fructoselysine and glucos
MKHYIIASHGTFAKGIYESIKIIVGEQENVHLINGFVESNDIEEDIKKVMNEIPENAEIIAMSDVFGGSVNNELMKHLGRENYYLITGMNLPLLMQIFLAGDGNTKEIIENIVNSEDTTPKFCNPLIEDVSQEDEF